MIFSLVACNREQDNRPKDLDDPMPEIWEEGYSTQVFAEGSGDILSTDLKGATEVTIGVDQGYRYVWSWYNKENLENIYVEDGHPTLASEDGVLYSKSFETLIRWPAKKLVTMPRDTIKYFARDCFYQCIISEDFELPDGTISIGPCAFYLSTITKIHIKENVKTVGDGALQTETLKTIEISSPIVYRYFFTNQYVETVIFNEGVKQIRANGKLTRFSDTFPYLSTVEFPDTLEVIGDVDFPVNIAVKKYILKENIKYLSEDAFHDYIGKTSFVPFDTMHPLRTYRKCKTEFDYSCDCVKAYLDRKMLGWEKNWSLLLKGISERITEYKEYEAQGRDGNRLTRITLEEYLEELRKL